MSKVKALTPESEKPSLRMPSTNAPSSAPITVPDPPVSSVPPITAEAMAANMISDAAGERIDRADAEGIDDAGEARRACCTG